MRKLIMQNFISIDGYFEGPNHDLSWHNVDSEFNRQAIANLDNAHALLFGRITYELMASYWPTPHALTDDPIVAGKMNSLQKIVFSRTLRTADWANSRLVNGDAAGEIRKLKQQEGKNLLIFGSSDLVVSIMGKNLIDEYDFYVNPVILGKGKSIFQGAAGMVKVKLLETRIFASGNVLLRYGPLEK